MRPVDADKLEADMTEKVFCGDGTYKVFGVSMDQIKKAPTITPPPNAPLTPDQLREMESDWVWIKLLVPFYRFETGYYLKKTQFSDTSQFCCGYPGVVVRNLLYTGYGDTWTAYRRKPEEGTVHE